MRDWITKLDEFLKISGRELLNYAGMRERSRNLTPFLVARPQLFDLSSVTEIDATGGCVAEK